MLKINGLDIATSQGDTFRIVFEIDGYTLIPSDILTFTAKDCCGDTVLKKVMTGISGKMVEMECSAEEMKAVQSGECSWDLLLDYSLDDGEGTVRHLMTLNFPSRLKIVRVVHDGK